ncbi:hypothetical protein IE81DRAFT_325353 [Ceraceosorus guamensis]|uniref:Uncharacterized protein n=1 Tax=Ceraceosorus guamensis TaxID=1522189 RepID=A0A316VSV3_9BASI|nr:hypothetical protein IE81DRAFT_325353 [Ceraceosorus guamensis]PWN40676.1 hypothetical protein IE81DRAFT_325353 [Ceraceosorus guamensis]
MIAGQESEDSTAHGNANTASATSTFVSLIAEQPNSETVERETSHLERDAEGARPESAQREVSRQELENAEVSSQQATSGDASAGEISEAGPSLPKARTPSSSDETVADLTVIDLTELDTPPPDPRRDPNYELFAAAKAKASFAPNHFSNTASSGVEIDQHLKVIKQSLILAQQKGVGVADALLAPPTFSTVLSLKYASCLRVLSIINTLSSKTPGSLHQTLQRIVRALIDMMVDRESQRRIQQGGRVSPLQQRQQSLVSQSVPHSQPLQTNSGPIRTSAAPVISSFVQTQNPQSPVQARPPYGAASGSTHVQQSAPAQQPHGPAHQSRSPTNYHARSQHSPSAAQLLQAIPAPALVSTNPYLQHPLSIAGLEQWQRALHTPAQQSLQQQQHQQLLQHQQQLASPQRYQQQQHQQHQQKLHEQQRAQQRPPQGPFAPPSSTQSQAANQSQAASQPQTAQAVSPVQFTRPAATIQPNATPAPPASSTTAVRESANPSWASPPAAPARWTSRYTAQFTAETAAAASKTASSRIRRNADEETRERLIRATSGVGRLVGLQRAVNQLDVEGGEHRFGLQNHAHQIHRLGTTQEQQNAALHSLREYVTNSMKAQSSGGSPHGVQQATTPNNHARGENVEMRLEAQRKTLEAVRDGLSVDIRKMDSGFRERLDKVEKQLPQLLPAASAVHLQQRITALEHQHVQIDAKLGNVVDRGQNGSSGPAEANLRSIATALQKLVQDGQARDEAARAKLEEKERQWQAMVDKKNEELVVAEKSLAQREEKVAVREQALEERMTSYEAKLQAAQAALDAKIEASARRVQDDGKRHAAVGQASMSSAASRLAALEAQLMALKGREENGAQARSDNTEGAVELERKDSHTTTASTSLSSFRDSEDEPPRIRKRQRITLRNEDESAVPTPARPPVPLAPRALSVGPSVSRSAQDGRIARMSLRRIVARPKRGGSPSSSSALSEANTELQRKTRPSSRTRLRIDRFDSPSTAQGSEEQSDSSSSSKTSEPIRRSTRSVPASFAGTSRSAHARRKIVLQDEEESEDEDELTVDTEQSDDEIVYKPPASSARPFSQPARSTPTVEVPRTSISRRSPLAPSRE